MIIILLLIIIIGLIVFNISSKKEDTVYFFLNKNDENSFKLLKNILKKSESKIILVNYDKGMDILRLNKILNQFNKIRPIHQIINIENMQDLENILYNRKCINQPSNKYYELINKVGVFGYPFDFENNESELLNNDSDNDNNKIHKSSTNMNNLRQHVDVPTCGRRRSGCN